MVAAGWRCGRIHRAWIPCDRRKKRLDRVDKSDDLCGYVNCDHAPAPGRHYGRYYGAHHFSEADSSTPALDGVLGFLDRVGAAARGSGLVGFHRTLCELGSAPGSLL